MRTRLLNARAIQFTPALAKLIGLNEAILLQQIHFWLEESDHEHDGATWIYNTYDEWEAQFPFMSRRELIRAMKRLVDDLKLVKVKRFNQNNWDRTNWYTILYPAVEQLEDQVQAILGKYEEKRVAAVVARKRRNKRVT